MPDDNVDTDTPDDQPVIPTKTFTQEEVNAMLARETVKMRKQYADYADLKTAAQKLAQIEESAKSEEQRLREATEKAERRAQEADQRRVHQTMRVAIIAEAARMGMMDPEDAVRLIDPSELTIGEGDQVDGVKEAIGLLLANKPYLRDGRRRGGSELRGVTTRTANQLSIEQIRRWNHGEDGGWTPERMKQMDEALKSGQLEAR